jgi:hypothetical protein
MADKIFILKIWVSNHLGSKCYRNDESPAAPFGTEHIERLSGSQGGVGFQDFLARQPEL